jgi:hypothetical protein
MICLYIYLGLNGQNCDGKSMWDDRIVEREVYCYFSLSYAENYLDLLIRENAQMQEWVCTIKKIENHNHYKMFTMNLADKNYFICFRKKD